MGVLVKPEGKTILIRTAILIGVATVVTTIIYLTPIPEQYPQSCARQCHELDWPMICRVKLTLERYQTLSSACQNCPANKSACYNDNCITADGHPRGILTANRQFPGPALQVCQHDIIVIDVVNRIPGQSFGVHWRGQSQKETPYMDGMPMITQCPILSFTTFQYKFRATESGSHMWQVNAGQELLDTLFGPLIVLKPDSKEIHRKLYDTDDAANVVIIHPWNSRRVSRLFDDEESQTKLLINGKTPENDAPASVFKVYTGKKHRFRIFYSGGVKSCRIRLSIDSHEFLVIALDGHPIEPKMVSAVEMFPGERLDFVLHANRKIGSYHLRAVPVEPCHSLISTFALVQYTEAENSLEVLLPEPDFSEFKTSYDEDCDSKNFLHCLQSVRAVESPPEALMTANPDAKFYFLYDSAVVSSRDGLSASFREGSDEVVKVPRANNLTMILPSSPLLSQSQQIDSDDFCRNGSIPDRCIAKDVCECVHVVNIPLNGVVELVLINRDKIHHVFHLHGYSFRVLGASKLPPNLQFEDLKSLDEAGELIPKNFDFPMIKDTVAVVNNSAVALRFVANNPGYWLLDDEQSPASMKGMSLVLRVGEKSDLSPVPHNFPKCGNWIGPEFFLI